MDMIVDRLSAIEQSASRIMDSAAAEKKRLEEQAQVKIAEYDAMIDRETKDKLHALQKVLDTQMTEELSSLKQNTETSIHMMEADYEANHRTLAEQILHRMTKG